MRNIALVLKHEIKTTLEKRSFWLMTFLFPLLIIASTVLPQMLARSTFQQTGLEALLAAAQPRAAGYVDAAAVIRALPPGFPPALLRAYPDEASARAGLAAGEVSQYYLIPADFVATGDLTLVDSHFSAFTGMDGGRLMEYVLNYNLVGDPALARLLIDPTPSVIMQSVAPAAQNSGNPDDPFLFAAPFVVMFILFFAITMSAGFMLQSVAKEKENRTAEILLLSVRPRELMLGKVLGLGLVALLQLAVWMGGAWLALNQAGSFSAALANFTLPPGFAIWAVLYFLFGYILYASLLGALGALAPTVREGTQFTFLAIMPLLAPIWLNAAFTQAPDGALATALSLFPLTAPTAMATRLSVGHVPFWQPVVSLIGLIVTTYLFVLLAARLFRADTLLSDASLNWGRLRAELRGAVGR
jgi:ABC-2 type transport system permease protein